MYVKKFEADTLDEALKQVKQELGPDAIILKTKTNKIAGAFKRKKIEITAAISEKSYGDKINVDNVLNNDEKNKFYQADAGHISKMIGNYNGRKETSQNLENNNVDYGGLGLNKVVQQQNKPATQKNKKLDDFLSGDNSTMEKTTSTVHEFISDEPATKNIAIEKPIQRNIPRPADDSYLNKIQDKVFNLEEKICELERTIEEKSKVESNKMVKELDENLQSLGVSPRIIQRIIKNIYKEFSQNELNNYDELYDFALSEISGLINVDELKSNIWSLESGSVNVIISDGNSGQTSVCLKLAAKIENSVVLQFGDHESKDHNFAVQSLRINIIKVENSQQLISECRQNIEKGKTIFIDFKRPSQKYHDTQHILNGLKRSFDKVEILISLSGIHSDYYNKNVVAIYNELADGLVVSFIDQWMRPASILNMHYSAPNLPLKLFCTGRTIPTDMEKATKERLMSSIFELD